jgi:ribokinase
VQGRRVIVVGSANADLVFHSPSLPRPGETVVGADLSTSQGGKGANQSAAAGRLGADTWLVGCVGEDAHGRAAIADLQRFGVMTDFVAATSAAPTGVAAVVVDGDAENQIVVASGANALLRPEHVRAAILAVGVPGAVVLACLEVPDEAVVAAAEAAHEAGCHFVLNPAPARRLPAALLARCSVLTPNRHELAALGSGSTDDLLAAGAGAVVVTLGSDGARIHESGRAPVSQPAFKVDAVDTTGAGDAFSAALSWALAGAVPLPEAVRLAGAAGALSTRAEGARGALPTAAEVTELVSEQGR